MVLLICYRLSDVRRADIHWERVCHLAALLYLKTRALYFQVLTLNCLVVRQYVYQRLYREIQMPSTLISVNQLAPFEYNRGAIQIEVANNTQL